MGILMAILAAALIQDGTFTVGTTITQGSYVTHGEGARSSQCHYVVRNRNGAPVEYATFDAAKGRGPVHLLHGYSLSIDGGCVWMKLGK